MEEYLAALGAELTLRYPPANGWEAETLYFGGGTPSMLGAGVSRLMALLGESLRLAPGAEVTLEANPEHVTPANVVAWRAAGITRLSIGAQSFDADALLWMHRTHSATDTRRALAVARDGGFDNVSLDLIFGLPASLRRDWQRDVDAALALRPAHLSLYGLTAEPATPLAHWLTRGAVEMPGDSAYESEFLHAHAAAAAAGYEHYEVSNFALPGARARHNSSYWSGASYAGLGPSAHELDGDVRRWNIAPYVAWRDALRAGGDPVAGHERLTDDNRLTERVYLGLRTADGLRFDMKDAPVVDRWLEQGWAEQRAQHTTLTPLGWLRLDSLAADLTYARSRS